MKQKRFSAEQIVDKLRQVEVLVAQGQTVARACKAVEITEQTYYRWRKEYGGLKTDQAKRLKNWSVRTPGSSACWPMPNWTRRFCGRRPAQTSEPAAEAPGSRSGDPPPGCQPAAGVPVLGQSRMTQRYLPHVR